MKTFKELKEGLKEAATKKEIKVKGVFEYDSIGGKSIKGTTDLLVTISTTGSGKLRSVKMTVDNKKYYGMIPGRGMSAERTSKADIDSFLKRGRMVFVDLPNNEFNRKNGTAGTYSATLDPASLKQVNAEIASLNEASLKTQIAARGNVADAIFAYAKKNRGIDADDMKDVAIAIETGDLKKAKSLISKMDTDPREWILDLMKKKNFTL